ncbi:MAG: 50S ribosomal protein L25 [Myxococcales bacterium]|nr:50S ribosomal protein L25 [Myxococcales bacterium]|tara:strand:- start:1151 stop:1759 length:609 start_codon:yes stop_codon:yes gene_type:complete
METLPLTGTLRTTSGKGSNRKLRASGKIPATLYGHGVGETKSVTLDPRELGKCLENPKGANALFSFSIDGTENHTVLVREIQRDSVSRRILHVDLVAPNPEANLVATVDVNFSGKCPGVSLGGRLRTPYREVKVSAKPRAIPAEIPVDLGTLDIGDTIMASEIDLGEDALILFERDFVIAKVLKPRGKQDGDEEEATETSEE